MKKTDNIVDRFFNGTVKPSDFKYKWEIARWKNPSYKKVFVDLEKLGMMDDFNRVCNGTLRMNSKRANEIKAKYAELEKKYMSKNYTWTLKRTCNVVDYIANEMARRGKRVCKKIQETDNYAIMRAKSHAEHKTDRRFSSLSAMQKWVDKNNIGIDVYSLWEKTKKSAAKSA